MLTVSFTRPQDDCNAVVTFDTYKTWVIIKINSR